ncbi:MAG: thioredoxin family protein [Clostridium sp.]|uniref:thioredoxin family protein n=1 Tax=Clostridium TaxID=1485 RepID=UPI002152752A|nr:thioredoxin family protein [Clostridium sp. LY3-2]MCR6515563.1 thioredoxin family protein [Clostridium sp. LY3-2]
MEELKGLSYDEYLKKATKEHLDMIKEQEELSVISGEGISEARRVSEDIVLRVYSETRCKDAATALPILLEMSKINPKIKLEFFSLEENKEKITNLIGKAKIPTILRVDKKGNVLGNYIEFPESVNKKINDSNKEKLVKEFRSGIYSKIIENEFLDLIKKEAY